MVRLNLSNHSYGKALVSSRRDNCSKLESSGEKKRAKENGVEKERHGHVHGTVDRVQSQTETKPGNEQADLNEGKFQSRKPINQQTNQ